MRARQQHRSNSPLNVEFWHNGVFICLTNEDYTKGKKGLYEFKTEVLSGKVRILTQYKSILVTLGKKVGKKPYKVELL